MVGAVLIVFVSTRYALDRTLCSAWPSRSVGFACAAIYVTAIALLVVAWRGAWGPVVIVVHGIALFATPFLSSDPLMYAAVGRALARGATASTSVRDALGSTDPFLLPLVPAWRDGTSAYGPLWNALARALGSIAGDDLRLALHLHQAAACIAVLVAAAIVGRVRSGSFALIAMCPLAIVEATLGAHNDALLMPLVAAALWAWQRKQAALSVAMLALGLLVKASALIFLGPALLAMLLTRLPTRKARVSLLVIACVAGFAALFGFGLVANGPLDAVARIVGSPDVTFDHCTRSLECLPRVILRFVAHAPFASWVTGLVFRAIGLVWLAYVALRAAEAPRDEAVSWLSRGLFVYFLLLHGWAQSWYLLPLLPTLPFLVADARFLPAIRCYLVCAVAYYALVLPMSCLDDPVLIAASDLIEAMITVFPPVYLLLRSRRFSDDARPPLAS